MNRSLKSKAKTITAGIIIGALLFGGGFALAESAIFASPLSSKVTVDGKPFQAEAYSIEGSSYFKLRDVAKALDVGVWYDDENDSIHIETDIGYNSRYDGVRAADAVVPAPIQKPVSVEVDSKRMYDRGFSKTESFTASVSVYRMIRGEEADETIESAYVHNPSAGEGKEYVLAWFRAKISETENKYMTLSDIRVNMDCFSSSGKKYQPINPAFINPLNEDPKLVGEYIEGWIAFEVEKSDPAPYVRLGVEAETGAEALFALY